MILMQATCLQLWLRCGSSRSPMHQTNFRHGGHHHPGKHLISCCDLYVLSISDANCIRLNSLVIWPSRLMISRIHYFTTLGDLWLHLATNILKP